MNLKVLTDAQLQERLRRLEADLWDTAGNLSARRFIQGLEAETRSEIARRKQSRQHDVFCGHFASLLREDLAFERSDGDEWRDVDGEIVLVDDTRSDATDLVQCARGDYDYCVDEGAGWRWWPLAHGAIQQL